MSVIHPLSQARVNTLQLFLISVCKLKEPALIEQQLDKNKRNKANLD